MKSHYSDKIYVSQYDMALVQCGFMGAVLMYPDGFGIKCTKKELEDFIFFWRGLGYLLGIADEYNICNGNYEETFTICKEIEKELLLPSMRNPPKHFDKMADAYSTGMDIPALVKLNSTKSTIAFILDGMGLDVPWPRMSWMDWLGYLRFKLLVWFIWWIPGFESFLNMQLAILVPKSVQKYVYGK